MLRAHYEISVATENVPSPLPLSPDRGEGEYSAGSYPLAPFGERVAKRPGEGA